MAIGVTKPAAMLHVADATWVQPAGMLYPQHYLVVKPLVVVDSVLLQSESLREFELSPLLQEHQACILSARRERDDMPGALPPDQPNHGEQEEDPGCAVLYGGHGQCTDS